MEKTKIRIKDDKWCRLEVELKDGRLSICGTAGRIDSRESLEEQAFEYWCSFFEDSSEELGSVLERFPGAVCRNIRKYVTPIEAAARVVLDIDGPLHGIDVEGTEDEDGNMLVIESGGQIREELTEFFPEAKPYFKWHLNDMHAGCEHQEELGWGRGKDVALSRQDCTAVQLEILDAEIADEEFRSQIFKDSLRAPCPVCGYRYGTKWLERDLPQDVIDWFHSL